ncbi:hypothetical protein CD790_32845 [Streptomyces sp. SAJ15]|nr:hypothetical protein CD790_32845 [Streptomyces sp. SAJ15]
MACPDPCRLRAWAEELALLVSSHADLDALAGRAWAPFQETRAASARQPVARPRRRGRGDRSRRQGSENRSRQGTRTAGHPALLGFFEGFETVVLAKPPDNW